MPAYRRVLVGDECIYDTMLRFTTEGGNDMSLGTVAQLYKDLETLSKNSGHFAAEALLAIFNANLAEAKAKHPDDAVLKAIPVASGEVRIGDLLVRVGQLKAAMEDHG